MTLKSIVTAGLLGFVAISLLVAVADMAGWRVNQSRPSSEGVTATATSVAGATPDSQDAAPRLVAIYFHATHRCPTCKKIEAYSHEALQPEIDGGKLTWETADYTAPENEALVDKLQVLTSTVVMVEKRGGQIVRWKNLEEVWDHTHNQSEFSAFIHTAWKNFQENL